MLEVAAVWASMGLIGIAVGVLFIAVELTAIRKTLNR